LPVKVAADPTWSEPVFVNVPPDTVKARPLSRLNVPAFAVTVFTAANVLPAPSRVTVVPAAIVADVLGEAEGKAAVENEIRAAVRAGTLPLAAYERYGTF